MDKALIIPDPKNDRYATFAFIDWWKQDVVRNATALVAGVGALGNEVVKNLGLIGIGNLIIADFDLVEVSNLTRSVLLRESDCNHPKAEAVAKRAKELNPDVGVRWFHGNIARTLGLGVYRHADLVIGCLDNREARLVVNRACWKVNRPWVDGGMQELTGEMRVFWPSYGACYECTMTNKDYRIANLRYSCTSLARDNVQTPTIPTTPTISSIIAGLQVQEALKILHGMEVEPGKSTVFNGLNNKMYTVEHRTKPNCLSHTTLNPIYECRELNARTTTLREMLSHAKDNLGVDAHIELDFELLVSFECPRCHKSEQILRPVKDIKESQAACAQCGAYRWGNQAHRILGEESFLDSTLGSIGVPPLHIIKGVSSEGAAYFELSGDYDFVFSFD